MCLKTLLIMILFFRDHVWAFICNLLMLSTVLIAAIYMDSWRENWLQVQTTFSPLIYSLASPQLQTLLVSSLAPSEHILVPPRETSQLLFHVLYSQSLINNFHKTFFRISTSTTKSISSLFLHALSLLTATCKNTNDQQKTE